MNSFKTINEARKILGLGKTATLEEIKKAYKKLALKYHPDRCKEKGKKKCEEMFKKINHANDILMAYCINYKFSFKEEDIEKTDIDKAAYEHLKRFYSDWLGDLEI